MPNIKDILVIVTFFAGTWFFGYVVPNFIKLKYYRAFSEKTEIEEDTVAVKCTIWSVLSSMIWILFFFPLAFIAFMIWLFPPVKDGAHFVLSMWLMPLFYVLFLFGLTLLCVLVGRQAVFDGYGITVKKNIWGKPVFVPWNRVTMVDYDPFITRYRGSGFNFSYLPGKDKHEEFLVINFSQKNYIKGIEYAVKRIPQYKFWEDAQKKLKKMGIPLSTQIIVAPTKVTKINAKAFPDRAKLTSVTIPAGVKVIEAGTFEDCENMKSVTIPDSVTEIGESAFNCCVCLNSVTIPNGVAFIGEKAFFRCERLTSVTIPSGMVSIGLWAFDGCSGLTLINVAEDNTNYSSVDGVLFNKDKTVLIQYPEGKSGAYVIPNSVTKIEEDAFSDCVDLTSIEISNGVTEIGENAFADCAALKFVTIPDSVAFIGEYAFSGCENLTHVRIPSNVISIGKGAFWCDALKSIYVAADNANYSSSFDGILFNKTEDTLIQYPAGKSGAYTITDSVTKIEAFAFADCVGLTSVDIPNGVTKIGEYAFSDCKSLKSVTIPNGVKSINSNAFKGCLGLTSITVQKRSFPPKVSADAFGGISMKNVSLYVPASSISAYRVAEEWKKFKCIKPLESAPAGRK
jgi:hypothetical protein